MSVSADTRADRLHAALSTTFEGVFSVLDDASFERRAGHVRLIAPHIPIRVFNGVVIESEPCSGVADSIREVEDQGLPCGVQLRADRNAALEEEVARLGLTVRTPMPGMTVSPDELTDARAPDLVITQVKDEKGLAEGARVAAAAGGGPVELFAPLFTAGLLELPGFAVYLGHAGGEAVTVAMGYRTNDDVGIFNVGTSPEHRRRGYGGAITAHAARAAFESGADLAWLQTSEMGESLYRSLGFRHVEMHFLLGRPRAQVVSA